MKLICCEYVNSNCEYHMCTKCCNYNISKGGNCKVHKKKFVITFKGSTYHNCTICQRKAIIGCSYGYCYDCCVRDCFYNKRMCEYVSHRAEIQRMNRMNCLKCIKEGKNCDHGKCYDCCLKYCHETAYLSCHSHKITSIIELELDFELSINTLLN